MHAHSVSLRAGIHIKEGRVCDSIGMGLGGTIWLSNREWASHNFWELGVVVMWINNTDHDSFVLQSLACFICQMTQIMTQKRKKWMSVCQPQVTRVMSQSDSPIPYFQASSRPCRALPCTIWSQLVTPGTIWSHLVTSGHTLGWMDPCSLMPTTCTRETGWRSSRWAVSSSFGVWRRQTRDSRRPCCTGSWCWFLTWLMSLKREKANFSHFISSLVRFDLREVNTHHKSSVILSLHVVRAAAVKGGDLEAVRSALAHQARHVPVVESPWTNVNLQRNWDFSMLKRSNNWTTFP